MITPEENVKMLLWLQGSIERSEQAIRILVRRLKKLQQWKVDLHQGQVNERCVQMYQEHQAGQRARNCENWFKPTIGVPVDAV